VLSALLPLFLREVHMPRKLSNCHCPMECTCFKVLWTQRTWVPVRINKTLFWKQSKRAANIFRSI
jgi:hypothetical protein